MKRFVKNVLEIKYTLLEALSLLFFADAITYLFDGHYYRAAAFFVIAVLLMAAEVYRQIKTGTVEE